MPSRRDEGAVASSEDLCAAGRRQPGAFDQVDVERAAQYSCGSDLTLVPRLAASRETGDKLRFITNWKSPANGHCSASEAQWCADRQRHLGQNRELRTGAAHHSN